MNIDAISNAVLLWAQALDNLAQTIQNATTLTLISGSFTTVNVTSLTIHTAAVAITFPSIASNPGSGIGTLNNTPGFGGDPQFWLAMNINGVNMACPFWTI